YHVLYGFFYLLSLLPWRVLYFISDCLYAVLYYVVGYRKQVVMHNLLLAFPEKTEAERLRIAKDFYHNFLDNFIEVIKLLHISEKEFRSRIKSNVEVLNALEGQVPNVAIASAHFFNWEYANLAISLESRFQLLTVYMPVKNKAFDKLMYKMREKFGAKLIPATPPAEFRKAFLQHARTSYALGLVSDQNPGNPNNAYWLPFFGRLTPFVKGAEKSAKSAKSGVVFLHFYKIKRGYYGFEYKLVTTDAKSYEDGQLTKELIRLTEAAIRRFPSNYLWSHRRWKWEYNEEAHGKLVVK
ncbi:MAG: KDO2-lipid lauroyltransferase, partial [Segetibacter sp.]|nr:KDO2-lipid lauroyltransferase [Segetibacter sp.]